MAIENGSKDDSLPPHDGEPEESKGIDPLSRRDRMLIAGATSSDPPPPPGPPVTVTAPPVSPPGGTFSPPPTTLDPGGPTPPPPPPPPPPPNSEKVRDYSRRCKSAAGSASDIAKTVIGAVVSGPPSPVMTPEGNDWTQVEFEVVIGGSGDSYGAIGNGIYSNNQSTFAFAPLDSTAVGVWHNHPSEGRSAGQLLDDRYPSTNSTGSDDWKTLQSIADRVSPGNASYNPSIFITDSNGTTREFKLSDRGTVEALSDAQRQQGVGLDGRDRSSQSCQ